MTMKRELEVHRQTTRRSRAPTEPSNPSCSPAALSPGCLWMSQVEEAAREREIARSVCVILREQVESLESRNAEACRQLDDLHQSMDSAVLERDVLAKECSSLQDKLSASEALAKDAIVAEEGAREELAEALRGLGAAERRVEGLKKAVRQQKEACKEAAERANAADREKEERALGIRALEAQLAEATAEGEERAREELRKAEASEAFAKKAERAMEVARRELEELKEERGAAEVEMQEAKATTMRLQAAVAQHQAESSCAQNKLAEVCLAKEGLEARMLQLEKELKDAQAQTTALEAAEMASREELSALHRRLETSEVAARKALEALREIESALSVAVEGKEGAERKISALEALVAEGEKAAAEATMRLEGMEKALREAEAAAACHIERLRVAEVEGADSEARVNALEAELGSLGEALHASEAAALAALASAEAVKAECLAAEGIRRAAEERAEELQASVARYINMGSLAAFLLSPLPFPCNRPA